eukprot:606336-Hanusia_phi.AAC.1
MFVPPSLTSTPETDLNRAPSPVPSTVPAEGTRGLERVDDAVVGHDGCRVGEGRGNRVAHDTGLPVNGGQECRRCLVDRIQHGTIPRHRHPGKVRQGYTASVCVCSQVTGPVIVHGTVRGGLQRSEHGVEQRQALRSPDTQRGETDVAWLACDGVGGGFVCTHWAAGAIGLSTIGLHLPGAAVHADPTHLDLVRRAGKAVRPDENITGLAGTCGR